MQTDYFYSGNLLNNDFTRKLNWLHFAHF